ncbi:MAG: HAD family hydrolase [Candidatus Hydrogenedentota bacterium]
MINAVIFDLDGTLVDSEILYVEAVQQLLTESGCEVTWNLAIDIAYGHGWDFVYEAMARHFPQWRRPAHEIAPVIAKHYARLRAERDIRIHGSVELLKRLTKEYPVAIVSGSYRQDIADAIEYLGIEEQVSFYIGSEDVSRGKPDPIGYRTAAQKLGVPPAYCLVFEDSAAGVTAAKAAGMHCVALARPGRPPQDHRQADLVLADLAGFAIEHYQ